MDTQAPLSLSSQGAGELSLRAKAFLSWPDLEVIELSNHQPFGLGLATMLELR